MTFVVQSEHLIAHADPNLSTKKQRGNARLVLVYKEESPLDNGDNKAEDPRTRINFSI